MVKFIQLSLCNFFMGYGFCSVDSNPFITLVWETKTYNRANGLIMVDVKNSVIMDRHCLIIKQILNTNYMSTSVSGIIIYCVSFGG